MPASRTPHHRGIHALRSLPSSAVTIGDLVPSWERSLRARGISSWTLHSYLAGMKKLREYRVAHDLSCAVTDVTRAQLEDFLADLLRTCKPSSVATRHTAVDQFFKWALAEGEVAASPMQGVRRPIVPETPPEVIGDDQLRALLKVCEGTSFFQRRDLALVRLLIDTGMRRSELAGLRVADVDVVACTAHVIHAKFGRPRTVAFRTRAASAIDRYLRVRVKHPDASRPELWLGRAGPLGHDAVYKIVKKRAAQAKIGHVWVHLFRHTSAHAWLEAGGSEVGLMKQAGWHDHKMLMKYGASLAEKRAIEEAQKLELGDRL